MSSYKLFLSYFDIPKTNSETLGFWKSKLLHLLYPSLRGYVILVVSHKKKKRNYGSKSLEENTLPNFDFSISWTFLDGFWRSWSRWKEFFKICNFWHQKEVRKLPLWAIFWQYLILEENTLPNDLEENTQPNNRFGREYPTQFWFGREYPTQFDLEENTPPNFRIWIMNNE